MGVGVKGHEKPKVLKFQRAGCWGLKLDDYRVWVLMCIGVERYDWLKAEAGWLKGMDVEGYEC